MQASADLRQRSAFRVLVPPLVFILILLVAFAVRAITGDAALAALIFSGGFGLLALWGVIDGAARALGRATFLGVGRGLDRLAGVVQVAMSIGLALALLPNAIRLIRFLGRVAGL